jgi:hypothetical protein
MEVAAGRYVLQIGGNGALIRDASRTERAHVRPRATPILLRPLLIRGFIGRVTELDAALSALDVGLPVEVSGERGIGKTALLRQLAHHPRAASFVDGILYLTARQQSFVDLRQRIFEAFYESDELCAPTDTEIRRGLRDKQALILLDDVQLTQNELERLLDVAPRSAFAVTLRERCLWGEVRSLALKGLPAGDAVRLLEREIERPLGGAERTAAVSLCEAIGGHPFRIAQAGVLLRERGISFDALAHSVTPAGLVSELMASTDDKERRALLALTALPGVSLTTQHIAGIAELTDAEPLLMTLVRRRLVVTSGSRHELADGVADQLRRTEDLKPWVHRTITYFTGWSKRYRRKPDALAEESDVLLRVQQQAVEARRWGEVLELGFVVEAALIAGSRWGAWGTSLERCLAAAKARGDVSAEALALHQIGTRAVCADNTSVARTSLAQALELREALNDQAAAAATRQNLSLVLPLVVESTPEQRSTPPSRGVDFESLPLRDENQLPLPIQGATTHRLGPALFIVLLFVVLGGVAYRGAVEVSWRSWNLPTIMSRLQNGLARATGGDSAMPPPPLSQPAVEPGPGEPREATVVSLDPESPRIRIFTARPGSMTTGGATNLCYAVNGAVQARLEPGIGEVAPTSTLTCLRVAPARTTTYELIANGRDGDLVTQQLVIVVIVRPS